MTKVRGVVEQLQLALGSGLPPYHVRRSRRARYLTVTVTPQHGVKVTVPPRVALSSVEPFLLQHQDWLHRELTRAGGYRAAREWGRLPRLIRLAALGRELRVDYRSAAYGGVRVAEQGEHLTLSGRVEQREAVCAALRRWLARTARRVLTARLEALSQASGLRFARCSIRGQQGRWGSGSSEGHICLNYKLLFLPPRLVDYVILHELTHTVHPDHSERFWARLQRLLPRCRARHRELQAAGSAVPWWAERL